MMKKLLLKGIDIYKKIPFYSHGMCKYYPSCSEYAKIAIERYGSFKGMLLTSKRVIKCNPLSKGGIDLVP